MPIKILSSYRLGIAKYDLSKVPSVGDYGVSENGTQYWFNGEKWIDILTGEPYKDFQDYLKQAELCK